MVKKERWIEIIKDFHERGIPELIERSINIPYEIPLKRVISIIGPRRAGKTYSMFQLAGKVIKSGADITRIVYVNFERAEIQGCRGKDLLSMMEAFYELYPQNRDKKTWLFLDEIQNVEEWEGFVRTVIDTENIQIFISGSSSRLLSREIATSMRGRTITYTVLPFSFVDHLTVSGLETGKHLSSSERSKIIHELGVYMQNGGYPEVVLYPEGKKNILLDIIDTTIYRDIVERYKIRNTKLLKMLIKSLISSEAREFSAHKFYNFIKSMGMKASKNAIYDYENALAEVFFIFLIRRYSPSLKQTEQSLPKMYLVDNGILTENGVNDTGRLMENLVLNEIIRRGEEVHYYKSSDGKEVDFVILEKKQVAKLIQVSFSLEQMDTKEREVTALLKASKELGCNNLLIITSSKEGSEIIKSKKINYVPLWKWMLAN